MGSYPSWPMVSVVIAVRDEAAALRRCLEALAAQDYPCDRLEIVVADGASTDGSLEVATRAAQAGDNVRVVPNPERATPFGFNAGIRAASGDVIVVLGAHTIVAQNFVRESVLALRRTRADVAGGVLAAAGATAFGEAVAVAVTSRLGVGQVAFRMASVECEADTVANGAYRREVLERVGLFDEELIRNQDDELNHRIRATGGKIVVTPLVKATYTPRSSPGALWKQYYAYGRFKVRVLQKHPRMMRRRHFVPAAAVFIGAAGLVGAAVDRRCAIWFTAPLASIYALAVATGAVRGAARIGWPRLPALALAYPILHFAYGTGFLVGLGQYLPRWWQPEPPPPGLQAASSTAPGAASPVS